uniref:hypothetical protein n=1 Tax=Crenothrix polyspora TaxID=360316 RepID=UPI001177C0DD
MSGGISAIRGFDYQATVILDILFDHFDQHGLTAQVRPEGVDDLDLHWTDAVEECRQFIQIKKPRENNNGDRNPSPWSLSEAINELFPNTIKQLNGNGYTQIWIVGDDVNDDLRSLVEAGVNAPISYGEAYWDVIHRLARNDATKVSKLKEDIRKKIQRTPFPKNLPSDPATTLIAIINEFEIFAKSLNAGDSLIDVYRDKATQLHASLPDILQRIEINPIYGTEQEVTQRVHNRLAQRYNFCKYSHYPTDYPSKWDNDARR